MTYALIRDGEPVEYPFDPARARAVFPDLSFPEVLTDAALEAAGVFRVELAEPPAVTAEEAAEEGPPEFRQCAWRQVWAVRARSESELAQAKASLWEQVKTRREAILAAGCTVPGIGAFQMNPKAMADIHEAVTGALLAEVTGQPFSIAFTLADNSRPELTAEQMMLAGKVVGERKIAMHDHSQDLRKRIEAAANFADLAAIDIEQDWPA